MSLDALRASALAAQFAVTGIAVTVTPADGGLAFDTTGIWLEPTEDDQPYGTDFQRVEPRRIMAFMRAPNVQSMARGTMIAAPELEGGDVVDWQVDCYGQSRQSDEFRVILKRVAG